MRYLLLVLALIGFAAPAAASLEIVSPTNLNFNSSGNDFAGDLASALGVTVPQLALVQGDIKVNGAGTLEFFLHASESGFRNGFRSLDAGPSVFVQEAGTGASNDFSTWNSGVSIGQIAVNDGTLLSALVEFFTGGGIDGTTTVPAGVHGPGSDQFGIFVGPGNGHDANRLYFGYDDNGANFDDNHDDLIISVVFTPAPVPEATTIVVWSVLGLIGVGAYRRLH